MFHNWNEVELRNVGSNEFAVYWVNPIRRFIESLKGRIAYILQELK